MDDEDRFSNSSGESDHENDNDNDAENDNEPDDAMDDADDGDNDGDNDNEQDEENNEDNEDNEDDEGDNDADGDARAPEKAEDSQQGAVSTEAAEGQEPVASGGPSPSASKAAWKPTLRQEALDAKLYDIVPTMAAPQATSVNAMAITPDLRYWFTGGSDGYIRKYDGPGTINGKLPLTVAQRHPFVDSVTKAGILMSYWENEEPATAGRGEQEHVLSPVYSLAVHSQALWLLSGLESGGINLQSVRHDEGKRIACLQQHTSAVSVLTMAPDEKSVLSGGWDKNIFDWDLNTGTTKRSFDGSGGQISSIELRPARGITIPTIEDEPVPSSTTISSNNGAPLTNGNMTNGNTNGASQAKDAPTGGGGGGDDGGGGGDGQPSPVDESLFGGSDAGSLFGETAGEQPFGQDDDDGFGGGMDMMGGHEGGMDHSADMAMAGMGMEKEEEKAPETLSGGGDAMDLDAPTAEQDQPETAAPAQDAEPTQLVSQSETEHPQSEITSQEAPHHPEADVATALDSQPPTIIPSPPSSTSDPLATSQTTFLSSAMDGTIRIWDRRAPSPVARIGSRMGVPPWCMSAVWSPDGNMIYAGRRNGTVEEFDVRKARRGWEPERTLKFPLGSGPVSALKPMANGRHLVCASHDILRLYDLQEPKAFKHSTVPFLIVPGPPRGGVIASLYVDPTSRFMLSAAGTRGWEGTSTEGLIGYEIGVVSS